MNKKIIASIICWLLIFSILPMVGSETQSLNIVEKKISLTFSEPIFQQSDQGQDIFIDIDEATSYCVTPGKPILPAYIKVFMFPFGTTIREVNCKIYGIREKNINNEIVSCPFPIQYKLINNFVNLIENYKIGGSDDLFPDSWYTYRTSCGLDGDRRVVFLTIGFYPIRYSSQQKFIQYAENVDISISYIEPPQVLLSKNEYDTIIIAPSDFSDELQPLIDFKNHDKITKLFTLDEIPSRGRDTQEDIKYFIKQAIENFGIRNVLLVGGSNLLPVRLVYVDELRDEKYFISDLYYADIYTADGSFSSWDTNENDVFGEYKWWNLDPIDDIDLYPDVYLGRLPCINENEVETCVNKIITYESNDSVNQNWFSNLIVVGGDTFPPDISGINEGERVNQAIIGEMSNFSTKRIWASNGKLYAAKNISNAIEEGAGFICFEGHSTTTRFYSYPHGNYNDRIPPEYFRPNNINELTNGNMLPIVTFNSCHPCKFNVNHTCLGWAFISNPYGGGIATMGSTASCLIYPGILCSMGVGGLLHLLCYRVYIHNNVDTFGELWVKSINEYLNIHPWKLSIYDYKTVESWEPFGDPSLRILNFKDTNNDIYINPDELKDSVLKNNSSSNLLTLYQLKKLLEYLPLFIKLYT